MDIKFKVFAYVLPFESRFIRERVFIIEQKFHDEFDENDKEAIHVVMYEQNMPIGTCRIIYSQKHSCYVIGRVAVLEDYRNLGLGSKMIQRAEKELRKRFGHIRVGVDSQVRVYLFYQKLGYNLTTDTHEDEGVPHVFMEKQL